MDREKEENQGKEYNETMRLYLRGDLSVERDLITLARKHIEDVFFINSPVQLVTLRMVLISVLMFTCQEYHHRLEEMYLKISVKN
jgi:hypothetical protein